MALKNRFRLTIIITGKCKYILLNKKLRTCNYLQRICKYIPQGLSDGFHVVPRGFRWFFLVIHGYTWLSLVMRGYLWLSLVIRGYPWLYVVILGYTWLSLVILGFNFLFEKLVPLFNNNRLSEKLTNVKFCFCSLLYQLIFLKINHLKLTDFVT